MAPSCLDNLSYDEDSEFGNNENLEQVAKPRFHLSLKCLKRMAKKSLKRLIEWLLEVEMGFVWGVAGLSIITFVFAAIWYIDPALLTLVLRFRKAECTTKNQAFLIGISNCSWTSCRLGCTREVYKCWQIQVSSIKSLYGLIIISSEDQLSSKTFSIFKFIGGQKLENDQKVFHSLFVSVFDHYFEL